MSKLTDFPPEEQELINEMLSLDYTREDFEKRKWELMCALSIEGLEYVKEHIFDIVVNKLETDTNNAIAALEKIEQDRIEKQKLEIKRCKIEEQARLKKWSWILLGLIFGFVCGTIIYFYIISPHI